jgi:hypothetical protein
MNKFSLIAIFIFAFTECCLSGFEGPDLENDPKVKLIIGSVCDVNKRPDATQWANLLNCSNHNKPPPPENEKYHNTVLIYVEKN